MIYKEEEIKFNKDDVFRLHVYAYFGELENFKKYIDVKIIKNFKETICYCISQGCKKNKEFVLFCKENFYFNNEEYKNSLAIGYILNGMWDKNLELSEEIIKDLNLISEENLGKICEIEELDTISSYLCTLYENELLFQKIKNPKIMGYTKTLITRYNLNNLFKNDLKFDPEASCNWFPFKIEEFYTSDKFLDSIFEQKLSYDNLVDIYGSMQDKETLLELSHISNLEEFIYVNQEVIETDKEINKHNILTDIRVLIKGERLSEKWDNLIKCKTFFMFGDITDIENNIFLEYIYQPYDKDYIPFVSEHQAWSIIYSIIKSKRTISIKFLGFDYIEINSLKAAYETCNNHNIMVLDKIYNKRRKCYKMIDFEIKKYIEKEEVNEFQMKFEKKLIPKDYIY